MILKRCTQENVQVVFVESVCNDTGMIPCLSYTNDSQRSLKKIFEKQKFHRLSKLTHTRIMD